MCMEDVLLGREAVREENYVAASSTVGQLLAQEASRFSIVLDNLGPNDVFIGFTSNVTVTKGLRIQPGDPPRRYDVVRDGRIVTDGFFVVCNAAETATVALWTTNLHRSK